MDIRQLQYLAALAREKHFTRAAQACNVTQPTLSERIRQLEEELGVAIVERGQRFHGFTAEGERVLKWAQVILDNWSAMRQEIGQLREGEDRLGGRLTSASSPRPCRSPRGSPRSCARPIRTWTSWSSPAPRSRSCAASKTSRWTSG